MAQKAVEVRVLCVDNDSYWLIALEKLLHDRYRVVTAASDEDALNIVRWLPTDIVIIDQQIVAECPRDLLAEIKKANPATLCILLLKEQSKTDSEAQSGILTDDVYAGVPVPWQDSVFLELMQKAVASQQQGITTPPQKQSSLIGEDASDTAVMTTGAHREELLFIGQDVAFCEQVYQLLMQQYIIFYAADDAEAVAILTRQNIAVLLLDISGQEQRMQALLKNLQQYKNNTAIVLFADPHIAQGQSQTIQELIFRQLAKPVKSGLLNLTVKSAVKYFKLLQKGTVTAESALIGQEDDLRDKFKRLLRR